MSLGKAIAVASEGFKNKFDKGGKPYILHCIRVMMNLKTDDDDLKSIAILHDVVEDEVCTLSDLWNKYCFNERVCVAVDILTHKTGDSYDDYIKLIALNNDARLVKLEDLKDNSCITRLKGLTKKDFDRIEKYHKAFVYLSKV